MKLLLVCLLLTTYFYNPKFIHNQNESYSIFCLYQLNFQPDSMDHTTKIEFLRLTINKDISLFEGDSQYKADSLLASPSFNQSTMNLYTSYIGSDITYKIFKLKSTNEIKYYDKIGKSTYDIVQNNKTIKWNIENINKIINGYKCRKATTLFGGRKWEAWYTTEIPVSDGPYKFSGLPGLIVSMNDEHKNYIFNLVKVKKTKEIVNITIPSNTIKVSQNKFNEAKNSYYLQKVTEHVNNNEKPEQRRQLIDRYKAKEARKNNTIELP